MTFDLSSGLGVKSVVRIIRDYSPQKDSRLVAVLTNRSAHEVLPHFYLDKNALETLSRSSLGLRGYRDDILAVALAGVSSDSPLKALAHFLNSSNSERISVNAGMVEKSLSYLEKQIGHLKSTEPRASAHCDQ